MLIAICVIIIHFQCYYSHLQRYMPPFIARYLALLNFVLLFIYLFFNIDDGSVRSSVSDTSYSEPNVFLKTSPEPIVRKEERSPYPDEKVNLYWFPCLSRVLKLSQQSYA